MRVKDRNTQDRERVLQQANAELTAEVARLREETTQSLAIHISKANGTIQELHHDFQLANVQFSSKTKSPWRRVPCIDEICDILRDPYQVMQLQAADVNILRSDLQTRLSIRYDNLQSEHQAQCLITAFDQQG